MKKTLQINIAGIVFTIEEDAYAKLEGYLKSIQNYFSAFEGSSDIISDIESRIAEKFLDKPKVDGTAVISTEDVNSIITSMGTVADFEAVKEEEDLIDNVNKINQSADNEGVKKQFSTHQRRLFRDTKRKALGGVLAGLAHHFHADVTWIRIIYLLLFFGLSPLTNSGISGIIFIAYIVCWVAFPANDNLEEDTKIKKFYRNPDGKVIGGVANGLAAYFGIDIAIVRMLFAIGFFFFGIGFMAYIILWIASPEAHTITQKMEMKGEPVTLENIETNVKKGLDIPVNAPESALTKIVLFPFRAVAVILGGVGGILKNLGPVARVFLGIILFIKGLALSFVALVASSVFFGLNANPHWINNNEFLNFFTRDITPWAGFFGTLVLILPAIALLLLGLSMILNRKLGHRSYWLTGLVVWFVGIFGLATIGGQYSLNFAKRATHSTTEQFTVLSNTLVLDSQNSDEDDDSFHRNLQVELEGRSENSILLKKLFTASGSNKTVALENAQNMLHRVVQNDSVLVFDNEFSLNDDATFRKQRLRMTLYLPYNKPFKMTRRFFDNLLEGRWHIADDYSVDGENVQDFTFVMQPNEGIVCLDCPKLSQDERRAFDENRHRDFSEESIFDGNDFEMGNENKRSFDVNNFEKIDISNAFRLVVRQGSTFSVEAKADRQSDLEDMKVRVRGNTLEIEYEDRFMDNREKVVIYITMPTLTEATVSGAVSAKIIGFDHQERFDANVHGASKMAVDIDADKVTMEVSGASNVDMRGEAQNVDLEASGASTVDVSRMKIKRMQVDASGASTVYIDDIQSLNSDTSGASQIKKK